MSEYGRYPEYKDSGVPWLGEIPSHWQNKRLKYTITNVSEKVDAQTSDLRYFGLENIQSFTGKLLSDVELVSEGVGNTFKKDDVLFGKLRPYLAKVYLAKDDGLSSTEALIFRATENIDPKFLFYYCLSPDFISAVNGTTFGSKMPRASWDDIASFKMVYPSLDEQAQIANFLDHELGKIDALIEKQQLLLDKLAEQRSAVITQAVTKGLNPNAEMKDSGVVWLGDVPYNWEVKKIRYLIDKIYTGSTPPTANTEYYDEGDWNWFNPADFKKSLFLSDSKKKINSLAIIENKVDLIPKNSVLIIGIGATLGKVGLAQVDCSTNQQINSLIINKENSPKFITYALSVQREIMSLISNSATLAIMNQEKTKSIILAVPPLAEQNDIVRYLDQESQKIDQMTETVNRTIERLKEYRSTLITQAVTGKIKVF